MALNGVGAFWKKEKNGKTFYSGIVEVDKLVIEDGKAQLLLYKNDYKKEDKHPDLQIMQIADSQDNQQPPQQEQQAPPPEPDDLDSIPF